MTRSSVCWQLVFCLLLPWALPNRAHAVSVDWFRQPGTNSDDYSTGVSADGAGNAYISGATGGSLAGPFAGGSYDGFLYKYSATGDVQWARQIGTASWDKATAVVADGIGNVFIAGETAGTLGSTRVGSTDSFVSKYDSAGDLQWTSQFNGSGSRFGSQTSSGIAADGLGNSYVTGQVVFGNSMTPFDAYVTKLDMVGNVRWTSRFGTSFNDQSNSVSVDQWGNVYVAGYTEGNFDGSPQANPYWTDAFLTKLDANGNVVWTQQVGNDYSDYVFATAADGQGNVYIAGATQSSLGGPFAGGFHDAFLAKYDSAGSVLWIRQLGDEGADEAYGVAIDSTGGVYITGNSDVLADVPSLAIKNDLAYGNSFVAEYGADGDLLWSRQLGAGGAKRIAVGGHGGVFISGQSYNTFDRSIDLEDAFLVKISGVPEPDALALVLLGMPLNWGVRRRALKCIKA